MFDLDQTLAESKQPLAPDMAERITALLGQTKVAVISGGALAQFLKQVVNQLSQEANLSNLYLLPTSGAQLYEYKDRTWKNVYAESLTETEAAHVISVLTEVAQTSGLIDFESPAWGERIENRGAQITLSALGQDAPIEDKKAWDPDKSKRKILQKLLAERLPEFAVGMGGSNSVDITRKGIDKAYGIQKIAEHLGLRIPDMLYVGDQLETGGNDEAATRTPIKTHAVSNPEETKQLIDQMLSYTH